MGHERYTGCFIKWYAEYYHNIKMDYLVSTDMSRGRAYNSKIFRSSVIDFNYRDIKPAIVWVTESMTEELRLHLENRGYVKEKIYFNFFDVIYGEDFLEQKKNK